MSPRSKIGIYTSWHDTTYSHTLISVIQHHRFTKSLQTKLRSVIGCPTGECIFSCQATYMDDVAAIPVPHPWQRFLRTIECSRQVRLQRLGPIVHGQLRSALEDSDPRIVHKDVEPTEFTIYKLKKVHNLCATPYIGSFSHHFTFRQRGQLCDGIFDICVFPATDRDPGARSPKRLSDCKTDPASAAGHDCVLTFEKSFHAPMLRRTERALA